VWWDILLSLCQQLLLRLPEKRILKIGQFHLAKLEAKYTGTFFEHGV